MILTPEERDILQKAWPILRKIAMQDYPSVTQKLDEEILYAVGNTNENAAWGFIDGPSPYLNDLLGSIPIVINENHSPFYIVQLTADNPKKLYKWNVEQECWKKLKQKP